MKASAPISTLLADASAALRQAGIESPDREARRLLAHALGVDAAGLTRDPAALVPGDAFADLVARRARHEPLAFLTGRREFWSLDLAVSPATLIPRPDTETLIEAAIAARPDRWAVRRILDLGTGTGALLLAAMSEFPMAFGVGIDVVPDAAMLARANARRLSLSHRVALVCGSWDAPISGRFDLVLCNPPYIPSAALGDLMPDVARYEPRSALDGGVDGLDAYRGVSSALPGLLAESGMAILEVGEGQADDVTSIARDHGLRVATSRKDLAGIVRAIGFRSTS